MLARVFTTAMCLSVRLSVTSRYCVRTKISSPSGSPMILVSDAKFHQKILRCPPPPSGASKNDGVGNFSDFLALSVNISKTVADTAKVTISD